MLRRIAKTAKFLTGWAAWSLTYPLMATEAGSKQMARLAVAIAKKYPERIQALRDEIEALMSNLVKGPGGMAPEATSVPDADMPGIVIEETPVEAAPQPTGLKRDITQLKARLGIGRPRGKA